MDHTVALGSSLVSLGLICAIYYCNIVSGPGSWLRGEVLAMVLLALFTGIFPLAIATSCVALWSALTGGLSMSAILSAGTDLAAWGAIAATALVFRGLVKATYRSDTAPTTVTPLTPRPANSGRKPAGLKKAA